MGGTESKISDTFEIFKSKDIPLDYSHALCKPLWSNLLKRDQFEAEITDNALLEIRQNSLRNFSLLFVNV